MQGSGTFSVEAMLGTFVPKTNKALVLSNGSYGKRCSTILNYLGRENDIIDMGDFLPPDPQLLEKKLVPIVTSRYFKNLNNSKSPKWMQQRLYPK